MSSVIEYSTVLAAASCTGAQLDKAIDQVGSKLSVAPVLLGVVANNVTMYGICNSPITINGTQNYIKQVADIYAEELVEDPIDIDTDPEILQSVSITTATVPLSGAVYYSNNYFRATSASFNIAAFVKPRDFISGDRRYIPGYMALPVLAQAIAIKKIASGDITAHTQYQDIAYKIINYLNVSFIKVMPKGMDAVTIGVPSDI